MRIITSGSLTKLANVFYAVKEWIFKIYGKTYDYQHFATTPTMKIASSPTKPKQTLSDMAEQLQTLRCKSARPLSDPPRLIETLNFVAQWRKSSRY